nr:MAG TPA: hypothetical protein [Caudoviricetes sp.]
MTYQPDRANENLFHYSLNYWLAIFNLYYFYGFRSIKVKIYILYSYFLPNC